MSAPALASLERRHAVAVVALEAPARRNALSRALLSALRERLAEAAAGDAGAVVLTGAGGAFSAGADVAELTGTVRDVEIDDAVGAAVDAIAACPLPVVAAVEGPCVGAAVDLALACDVRIAGAGASFAVPAVGLGILYNPAALARMARRLPAQTLARLLLLGERIGDADAVSAGLVAQVVPAGQALARAVELSGGAADGVPAARAATARALRALGAGAFRAEDHEGVRRDLLAAPERAARVRAAQARLGAEREQPREVIHADD